MGVEAKGVILYTFIPQVNIILEVGVERVVILAVRNRNLLSKSQILGVKNEENFGRENGGSILVN